MNPPDRLMLDERPRRFRRLAARAGLWFAAVAAPALLALGLLLILRDGGQDTPEQGAFIVCDNPLPALGPLVLQQFDIALAGMDDVMRLADQGDIPSARDAFFLRVHDFTHNVDGPLRAKDDGLAKALCRAVAQIEVEFLSSTPREAATVAEHAKDIGKLLRQAAAELGFER